jgi:hypothetical protein
MYLLDCKNVQVKMNTLSLASIVLKTNLTLFQLIANKVHTPIDMVETNLTRKTIWKAESYD